MLSRDLTQEVTELRIPVDSLHGIYDYTCAYPLTKAYFEKIHTPIKGYYIFNQSAHSPMFEEAEFVIKIMGNDVLAGTIRLADSEKTQATIKRSKVSWLKPQPAALTKHRPEA